MFKQLVLNNILSRNFMRVVFLLQKWKAMVGYIFILKWNVWNCKNNCICLFIICILRGYGRVRLGIIIIYLQIPIFFLLLLFYLVFIFQDCYPVLVSVASVTGSSAHTRAMMAMSRKLFPVRCYLQHTDRPPKLSVPPLRWVCLPTTTRRKKLHQKDLFYIYLPSHSLFLLFCLFSLCILLFIPLIFIY